MGALGFGPEFALGRARGLVPPPVPPPLPIFEFAGGVLPAGATLRRASAGRRYDVSGALVTTAADGARFDYDPVSHDLRGLLLEPAATNLLPWSDRIGLFGEKSGCAISADVGAAPDGTSGFDRIVPTVGDGVFPYVADISVIKAAGTTYTLSLFVRYETLRWALLAGDLYGGGRHAWFDLVSGTVGTLGANALGATIAAVGPGTWRIAVSFTGTTSPYCLLAPVKADASFGANYATGDTMGAWGATLEVGAEASSPIATAGAAAGRSADLLTLDWASRGVADGAISVRCDLDDGSTQQLALTVAGGTATLPTPLARPWLRRVTRS